MIDLVDERVGQDAIRFAGPLPEAPPGLMGEDVPLYLGWRRFPLVGPTVSYFNVRLGPPLSELIGQSGDDLKLAAQLLALRADLLHHDGARWWIVEFHGQAGLPQFGRLLAYPTLLRSTYGVDPPIRSLMVCTTANPFLVPLFTAQGIPILTFPDTSQPGTVLNPAVLV